MQPAADPPLASPGAQRSADVSPRLLNLHQAAAYLGVSYWTARDYVLAGHLSVVTLPALRPREGDRARRTLRRVTLDRVDLDAFVDARKRQRS